MARRGRESETETGLLETERTDDGGKGFNHQSSDFTFAFIDQLCLLSAQACAFRPRKSHFLLHLELQMGKAQEGSDEENEGERREGRPRPPSVSRV